MKIKKGLSNTCSEECHLLHRRSSYNASYHRRTATAEKREKINAVRRSRLARKRQDPVFVAEESRIERIRYRRRRNRIDSDPAEVKKERSRVRLYYEQNAERILRSRKEAISRLSPDEFKRFREGMRASTRRWRARWRTEMEKRPDLKQAYLDQMAEFRRRRRIFRFMAEASSVGDKG